MARKIKQQANVKFYVNPGNIATVTLIELLQAYGEEVKVKSKSSQSQKIFIEVHIDCERTHKVKRNW